MSDRFFLDTNVLVYAFGRSGDPREEVAWRLVEEAFDEGRGVVSTQVLQELYVTMTTKIGNPVTAGEARSLIERLEALHIVIVDLPILHRGIDLVEEEPVSFWDALVCAAAARAGCDLLYTEDLNDGQAYGSVTVRDPFVADD